MALMNIHLILSGKIAFGKTQVMNGIQKVGLSYPVSSANADDPFGKIEFLLKIIFKLKQRYGMDIKAQGNELSFKDNSEGFEI